MHYTYVLQYKKEGKLKFYVGSSADLKERMRQHKSGSVDTTKDAAYLKLVYYESCLDKTDARKREIQLKTGFGRGYLNKRLSNYLKEMRD